MVGTAVPILADFVPAIATPGRPDQRRRRYLDSFLDRSRVLGRRGVRFLVHIPLRRLLGQHQVWTEFSPQK